MAAFMRDGSVGSRYTVAAMDGCGKRARWRGIAA